MYRYGVALEGAVYWGNVFSFTVNSDALIQTFREELTFTKISQFIRCLKLSVQLFNLTLMSAFCLFVFFRSESAP